ncbi:MAG TPA: aldolase [Acetobacteraceae bacterium]|nr:aldolase [Acetobacteraceae bacterium]
MQKTSTRSEPKTATALPGDLARLARPSGAFAMLAIDQREALRTMLADHDGRPVADAAVTAFKLAVTRILSPYASAVLLDRQFVWDQAVATGVVAPDCALIAAADRFIPSSTEFVDSVEIDNDVIPSAVSAQGAAALKLLVIWRADEPAEPRVRMIRAFVDRCRQAGLISIIEPVARPPRSGGPFDLNAGVIEAAKELGGLGADLYKAQVPSNGRGDEAMIRAACAQLTKAIASPWVVLSSGVEPNDFPRAVELACAEGASGFLAGRAVWRPAIENSDREAALAGDAADRLKRLCEVADRAMAR